MKYDSKNQKAIFLEIPLIEKDYLALKNYFGNRTEEIILVDKTYNNLDKGLIRFRNKRVSGVNFHEIESEILRTQGPIYCDVEKTNELLRDLDGLEEIFMQDLELQYLPEEIYNLPKLKKLNAQLNIIRELSPDIKNLTKLENIDLNVNPGLKDLPREILALKNLKDICLYNTDVKKNSGIVKKLKEKGVIVWL